MSSTTVTVHPMPSRSAFDEETTRAEIYGVLATLFYAPPDESCSRDCGCR